MPKCELLEEDRRRAVEQRTTEAFGATDDIDQSPLEKRLEHTSDGNAADLFDLGSPDGLSIRDDRERLERRTGQPMWASRERTRSIASVLGARENPPPAPDFNELDAVAGGVVPHAQPIERRLKRGGRRIGVERRELVHRYGTRAREQCYLSSLASGFTTDQD